MKNYIKDNLTVKLFLITCSILIFVSLVICGLIAFLMPRSYVQVQNEQLDRDIKSLVARVENTEFMQAGKLVADFASQQQITLELHDPTKNLTIIFENSADYSSINEETSLKNDSTTITNKEYITVTKYSNISYSIPRLVIDGNVYSLIIAGLSTENEEIDKDVENLIAQVENADFTQAEQLWFDFVSQQQEFASQQGILLILHDTKRDVTDILFNDTYIYAEIASRRFIDFDAITNNDADKTVIKHTTTSYSISGLMIEGVICSFVIAGLNTENEELDKDLLNLIAQVENAKQRQAEQAWDDFVDKQQEFSSQQQILRVSYEASSDYMVALFINEEFTHKMHNKDPRIFVISNAIIGKDVDEIIDITGNTNYILTELMIDESLYSLTMTVKTNNEEFEQNFQNLIAQVESTNFTQAHNFFAAFASQQQINVEIHDKTGNTNYEIAGLMIGEKFYSLTTELSIENEQFDKEIENLIAQVENSDFAQAHNLLADFASQQQIALTLHDTSENLRVIFDNSEGYGTPNQLYFQKNAPNAITNHDYTIVTEYSNAMYDVQGVMVDGAIYSFIIAGLSSENDQLDEDLMSFFAQMESSDFTQRQQFWANFVRQQQRFAGQQQLLCVFYDASIKQNDSMLIYEYGFGDEYRHTNKGMDSSILDAVNAIVGKDADAIVTEISYQVSELIIDEEFYTLSISDVSPENEQFEKNFQNLITQAENTDFRHAKTLLANFAGQHQIIVTLHNTRENISIELGNPMGYSTPNLQKAKNDSTDIYIIENAIAESGVLIYTTSDDDTLVTESSDSSYEAITESDNVVISIAGNADPVVIEINSDTENAIADNTDFLRLNSDIDTIASENGDSSYEVLIEGQIYSLIITGLSTEAVNQITFVLKNILPWIILVMTGLSFVIAIFSSKMITKPIKRLNDAAKQIAELSFDVNCDEKRTDELGQLAKNINFLSSKLNTTLTSLHKEIAQEKLLEEKQRLFFAAASHELKTPLTIIKGNLEGMFYGYKEYQDKDTYISSSLRITCEMQKLINEILHVSQLDAKGVKLQLEAVDIKSIIDDIVENYEEIIELKKFTVICQLADVSRQVDKALFIKALQNIIGNAFHYSPDGAKVAITLSEKLISVENFDVTLAQSEIKKVFQPFYRVEKSRNRQTGGSGLGLHFVRTILEQHKLNFSMVSKKNSIVFEIQL